MTLKDYIGRLVNKAEIGFWDEVDSEIEENLSKYKLMDIINAVYKLITNPKENIRDLAYTLLGEVKLENDEDAVTIWTILQEKRPFSDSILAMNSFSDPSLAVRFRVAMVMFNHDLMPTTGYKIWVQDIFGQILGDPDFDSYHKKVKENLEELLKQKN